MPVTLDDLRRPCTATGFRHVYRPGGRRTRPYRAFIVRKGIKLGYYPTAHEAAKAVLDYMNGKLLKIR